MAIHDCPQGTNSNCMVLVPTCLVLALASPSAKRRNDSRFQNSGMVPKVPEKGISFNEIESLSVVIIACL
jgi:hypothetical protein